MKIQRIEVKHIRIPLKKPFRTALRTVAVADNIIVLVKTDDGQTGYGEAPPTAVITGDTREAITAAVNGYIEKDIAGLEISNL